MAEQTATQTRLEAALREQTRRMLEHNPEALVEAIVKHYCSVARIAFDLGTIIKFHREEPNAQTAELIAHLTRQIAASHVCFLGIEPAWPNRKS